MPNRLALVCVFCSSTAVALAQDPAPGEGEAARDDTRAGGGAPEERALRGEAAPADPTFDDFVRWNSGLDAIREDRRAQLRLTAARRLAPFDLAFGLEE